MKKRKLLALLLTGSLTAGLFLNPVSTSATEIVTPLQQDEEVTGEVAVVDEVQDEAQLEETELVQDEVATGVERYEDIGTAVESFGTTIIQSTAVSNPEENADEAAVGGSFMKSGLLSVLKPSQKSIAQSRAAVVTASDRFATVPGTTSPYALGKLSDEYLQSAITYVNYIRMLAGLDELSLNDNLNTNAQYGAVVLAANCKLSHSPAKPSDMNNNFYLPGKAAAGTSNIYTCYGYPDVNNTLQRSIDSYMKDNTSVSNLKQMGHRRWILYPSNVRTGFGQADAYEGNCFAVMKVMRDSTYDKEADDPDSYEDKDYNFISWPASGNFPSDSLPKFVPWSVTVNPSVYGTPSASKIKVTVTRVSDLNGKSWEFTSDDVVSSPTKTMKYLSVDTAWTGVNNCITFNLGNELDEASYSGLYQVDITGLTKKNGTSTSISYQVDFFDINNPNDDEGESIDYDPTPVEDIIDGKDESTYTVTFHPENGEADTVITDIKANTTIEIPQEPAQPTGGNYTFMGWYTQKGGLGTVFDESVQVNRNYELYAYWKYEETQAVVADATALKITAVPVQTYTGAPLRPSLVVKNGKILLTENEDYRLSYRNNTNAGTAIVTLYGQGSYSGYTTVTFTIAKNKIKNADIWLEDQTANGFELTPKVHARDEGGELVQGVDYRISATSGNLSRAGKVTVTLEGIGDNYTGTVKKTFLIASETDPLIGDSNMTFDKETNSSYDIDDNGAFIYTGYAIKPVPTVRDAAGNIVPSKYYKLTYKKNKNAGIASVTVTGRKGYKGSFVKYFTIAKRDISTVTVARISEKTYTGTAIKPKPSATAQVKVNGKYKTLKLKAKKDYKVSYSHNKDANNEEITAATITLTGNQNFTGQIQVNFTITAKGLEKGITVKGLKTYKYDGVNPVNPTLTLFYKKKQLIEGVDYIYTVTNNTAPGKATVTISSGTGGNFKGTLTKNFKIK